MIKAENRKFGPLEALCHFQEAENCVLLLHGYGADAANLFPIADFCKSLNLDWVFLEAPLLLDLGYGMQGRAWFPIDMEALERAIQNKSFREFNAQHLEGYQLAQKALAEAIHSLNRSSENLILGGFSQGAMLSTDYFLSSPDAAKALSLFSGTFIDEAGWEQSSVSEKPVFQSHGQMDPLLDFQQAARLHELFVKLKMKAEFHPFPGGHEIPLEVLQKWQVFLKKLL